jgi:hypothetical protein
MRYYDHVDPVKLNSPGPIVLSQVVELKWNLDIGAHLGNNTWEYHLITVCSGNSGLVYLSTIAQ